VSNIQLNLTEEEAAIVETLFNEALTDLSDEIYIAEEYADWEEYDLLFTEYEFLDEIIIDLQMQFADTDVFV